MRTLLFGVLAVLIFSFAPVYAQGFYIGAGIGNTFVATEFQDLENQTKELSENSTGYKFFAGFNTPTIFGVEGGYRNLGTVTISEFEFESETKGWDVYGMGRFQILNIVDLFAKAGVFFWKTESNLVETVVGKTGTDFAWGLGAGVHLGPIGVRLEYENFKVEDPLTLSMLTLSATFGF